MMLMRRPIFEPISGPPQATLKVLPPHSIMCLLFVEVILVTQVLVKQGQWICPACSGGMESVAGAGAGAAAVVGDAGAAAVVPFCLDSFTAAAPGIVLQETLLVTSVRLPPQSVIFFPFSRNAIILDPSIIRNCLLVPFTLLITNFCPILHPLSDILSITHKSTN